MNVSTELASISVTLNNLETRVADQQRDHITEFTTLEIAELGAIRHKMRQCAGALGTFASHAHERIVSTDKQWKGFNEHDTGN